MPLASVIVFSVIVSSSNKSSLAIALWLAITSIVPSESRVSENMRPPTSALCAAMSLMRPNCMESELFFSLRGTSYLAFTLDT